VDLHRGALLLSILSSFDATFSIVEHGLRNARERPAPWLLADFLRLAAGIICGIGVHYEAPGLIEIGVAFIIAHQVNAIRQSELVSRS